MADSVGASGPGRPGPSGSAAARVHHVVEDLVEPRIVAFERSIADRGLALAALLAPLLVLEQRLSFGSDLAAWDWPSLVAGLTLAFALPFALRVAKEARRVVERLERRHVLESNAHAVRRRLDQSAERWARWAGHLTGATVLVLFLAVWGITWRPAMVVFATASGVLVGRVVGRLTATSRLGHELEREGHHLTLRPGHPDGTGGLRVVGDHYFRQAMVLAVPALWLAVRLSVPIPMDEWRSAYIVLLVVVVGLQVVAFVLPLRAFHQLMRRSRAALQPEMDRLGADVARLLERLSTCDDDARRKSLEERIRVRRERYEAIDALPSWPIATDVRRRFTWRNVALLTPGVLNAIGIALPGADLLTWVADVVGTA